MFTRTKAFVRSAYLTHKLYPIPSSSVQKRVLPYISYNSYRSFSDAPIDIPLPPLADSIDSGTLASWEKNVGDYCKMDDVIAILDTDKVSVDVKAPESGELVETLAEEGDELKVGDIIARLIPKEAPAEQDAPAAETKEAPTSKVEEPAAVEKAVPATPPKTEAAPTAAAPTPTASGASSSQQVLPNPLMWGNFATRTTNSVKMTPMRKKTAERLKESQNTAASLTTFNEIDMSNLFNLRNTFKDAFLERHGVKLGFMSAFVAASVKALQEIPVVNARTEDDHIVYHDYIDISVAVSSPKGLVVPVIRDAQTMNFKDIEVEIMNLATKARDNKLTLEDMSGGTFTITNGGVFGSMMSTPMINMPQSAILGMHGVKERAVVVDGKIEIRPMMYVALTYDHRIIDGRESVTFLKSIKEKVEDPQRLLLNL